HFLEQPEFLSLLAERAVARTDLEQRVSADAERLAEGDEALGARPEDLGPASVFRLWKDVTVPERIVFRRRVVPLEDGRRRPGIDVHRFAMPAKLVGQTVLP